MLVQLYICACANVLQGYTPGYPTVGENIVHPPPNPTFPPQPQPPYSGYPAASPTILPNPVRHTCTTKKKFCN